MIGRRTTRCPCSAGRPAKNQKSSRFPRWAEFFPTGNRSASRWQTPSPDAMRRASVRLPPGSQKLASWHSRCVTPAGRMAYELATSGTLAGSGKLVFGCHGRPVSLVAVLVNLPARRPEESLVILCARVAAQCNLLSHAWQKGYRKSVGCASRRVRSKPFHATSICEIFHR